MLIKNNCKKILSILIGIVLALVFLEIIMRLTGSLILYFQERDNKAVFKNSNEYRIVCFGESTTVWGGKKSWSVQLEKILNEQNLGINFKVINKGRQAIQTSYIMSILEDTLDKYQPDMVITMMGINDGDNSIPYESGNSQPRPFYVNLKIYRLAKLLKLHIADKIQKIKLHKYIQYKFNKDVKKEVSGSESLRTEEDYLNEGHLYMKQEKRIEAEEMFKKAIEVNPDNPDTYIKLGWCYKEQKRYPEAMEMIKKAQNMNPTNSWSYVELGNCYKDLGKYQEAEEVFKKALAINPNDSSVYIDLGLLYQKQGLYSKAIAIYNSALSINCRNKLAYVELGQCYSDQKMYQKAEEILKKSIIVEPDNYEAYIILAQIYRDQSIKESEQESLLKKVLDINPSYGEAYIQLGWFYKCKLEYQKAEEMFKEAIKLDSKNPVPYIELADCYRKQDKSVAEEILFKNIKGKCTHDRIYGYLAMHSLECGDDKMAQYYFDKANSIRIKYHPESTCQNYKRLKSIVERRGIQLVCVQYPMRNVESLKKMFSSIKGIIFVDNEAVFKEAVKQGKYSDYFEDIFAGDFGHGTPLGNKLLAENIANVIIKDVFHKN